MRSRAQASCRSWGEELWQALSDTSDPRVLRERLSSVDPAVRYLVLERRVRVAPADLRVGEPTPIDRDRFQPVRSLAEDRGELSADEALIWVRRARQQRGV